MDNPSFPGDYPAGQGSAMGLFGNVEWGVREYDGVLVLTATVDGVFHYEAAGICRITEHRNVPDAIAYHVAPEQKVKLNISAAHATIGHGYSGATWENVGPNPYRWFITREGANRLVLDSRVPGAQRIKRWLADDVMPSIEDTGAYIPQQAPSLDIRDIASLKQLHEAFGQALALVETERSGRLVAEAKVKELEPGAAQAETYAEADGLITKRAFARDVIQWYTPRGIKITHQQVYDFLGYIGLITRAATSEHDQATTHALNEGRAKNSTKKYERSDGTIVKVKYGKLTPKGEKYAWKRIFAAIGEHNTLDLKVIRPQRPA